MTSQPKKRYLPRFGLKSMFFAVLVVAVYFGSWPWLEERAKQDVVNAAIHHYSVESGVYVKGSVLASYWEPHSSFVPYIIHVSEPKFIYLGDFPAERMGSRSRHYLWAFGWSMRLPMTTSD